MEEGDAVKEGQPIVQLENAKEELAVQEAQRLGREHAIRRERHRSRSTRTRWAAAKQR